MLTVVEEWSIPSLVGVQGLSPCLMLLLLLLFLFFSMGSPGHCGHPPWALGSHPCSAMHERCRITPSE